MRGGRISFNLEERKSASLEKHLWAGSIHANSEKTRGVNRKRCLCARVEGVNLF